MNIWEEEILGKGCGKKGEAVYVFQILNNLKGFEKRRKSHIFIFIENSISAFMKILLPVFILCSLTAASQNTNPDTLGTRHLKLKVNKIAPSSIKFPFNQIKIIDNRFDTSKIGFVPVVQIIRNKKRIAKKLTIDGGVAKGMEKYFNEYYGNSFTNSSLSLLVVLKKFWLSGIDDEANKEVNIRENMYAAKYLYCKMEYYLCKEGLYYPFKRLDTVVNEVSFEGDLSDLGHFTKNSFKLVLSGLIETVDYDIPIEKINTISAKTIEQVKQFNSKYFNVPILNDTPVARGIFLTFEEFKNNKPSLIDFKEKEIKVKGRFSENYLEDAQGNRIVSYWGYNTGTDIKIGKFGNEKLYRKNNTFEFFVTARHTYVTKVLTDSQTRDYEFWIPYQLDMETGNIY